MIEKRPANLRCNNCGHCFEDLAWFVYKETDEGYGEWIPATGGTSDNVCPSCGSGLIGFA